MGALRLRLSGSDESVNVMLNALRGLPGVDRLEEMGATGVPRRPEDSSSAGLPDDTASGTREVEIHAAGEAATQRLRDRAEIAARDAGVVMEWLEPF